MASSPHLESVPGFKLATVAAEIRNWSEPRHDLALIVSDQPAAAAGMFTQNQVAAAPVKLDQKHLKSTSGSAKAILVNAGIANACTGAEGMKNAKRCAEQLAKRLDAEPDEILVASTGVIGRQLPMEKMEKGIDDAVSALGSSQPGGFAKAIMTTDLKPKEAGAILEGDDDVLIAGACKGSGMIAPNMATMLAFILTNASITPKALRAALDETVGDTFNMVTVDGDTSTNDSVFVLASGASSAALIDKVSGKRFDRFVCALGEVCLSLARQIAMDGEGATKLVKIKVINARKHKDAVSAARTIAESPLVKTAMFGNDPNWGRIIAALGRSGALVEEEDVSLTLCGRQMFSHGSPVLFDAKELSELMRVKEIELEVDLGIGSAGATALTCDFSYEYVKINADYTT